ncbi:type II-A CRISPR-associated protein Csn2 [Streptococcus pyogenes]|uniref:type II-A CRISPR-associated protein Csn2 n=1 Tax=Streptococcus pyogenes TaxID=1314 RepID=UPI000B7BAD03|nr:type II-A CRISPR-associated protein Csn2 [Streptococcus pyogenes]ASO68522.1 type II-A CRISPR-associated protein Csn2 [Streptococcus pyogenes]ASO74237.1 type II-A CRISPR-associated protein Csn2 [Streptococcus pyogenes]
MNLNFSLLDEPIPLRGGTILVLEDVCVFSKIVQYCYKYEEDSELKFFDRKMKTIKESEIMLVTDILGFDVNSSTILKLIHADLESQFNEKPEVKSMIDKLVATITELIVFECLENELDLEYDEITILELIKSLGVKVETQSDTIFEKCLEILQIFKYLTKKKLLIFVNSGAFLAKDEVASLQEYISLTNLTVLFLEPRELYDFPQYILDEDYFLITKNMV